MIYLITVLKKNYLLKYCQWIVFIVCHSLYIVDTLNHTEIYLKNIIIQQIRECFFEHDSDKTAEDTNLLKCICKTFLPLALPEEIK